MIIRSNQKLKLFLFTFINIVFFLILWNTVRACNSSDWKLIFRHDVTNSAVFATDDEAKKVNENTSDPTSVDKYSRLFELENYRNPSDNKFEFKLVYPNKNITNIWKQSSNPVTRSTRWVDWYEAISIDSTAAWRWWLEHELWTTTFLDWVPNSSTWRWAIWSHRTYGNSTSIPWPWAIISLVELYVCADTTAPIWTISYSTTVLTNNDITATISLNETGTITNNNWSNLYTFTENWSFKFEFKDLAGNTWEAVATVNNIDKTNPSWNISYSTTMATSWNVTVSLTW